MLDEVKGLTIQIRYILVNFLAGNRNIKTGSTKIKDRAGNYILALLTNVNQFIEQ